MTSLYNADNVIMNSPAYKYALWCTDNNNKKLYQKNKEIPISLRLKTGWDFKLFVYFAN